ncbi:organic solute transporter alpha-like protein, partial [Lasius niger]
ESATIGGDNSDFPNNLILSALSSPAGRRSPKDQRDAGADAKSRALLLLALSALSEPSDDRRQFVLAKNPGPTVSYRPAEEPILVTQYGVYLQPVMVISILLGIYSLTVATKTLHAVAPEANLHLKTLVSQLVLLFSKLQAGIIKGLPATGVFPCNPPLTPIIYANVTYNSLMLFEMLLLCYAARHVYYVDPEKKQEQREEAIDRVSRTTVQVDPTNSNDGNK